MKLTLIKFFFIIGYRFVFVLVVVVRMVYGRFEEGVVGVIG